MEYYIFTTYSQQLGHPPKGEQKRLFDLLDSESYRCVYSTLDEAKLDWWVLLLMTINLMHKQMMKLKTYLQLLPKNSNPKQAITEKLFFLLKLFQKKITRETIRKTTRRK